MTKRTVLIAAGDGTPFRALTFNRNAPCKCGSGKKQKNCCGCETKLYHSKKKPILQKTESKLVS